MNEIKIVYQNGRPLLVRQTVLVQMGLIEGQSVTERQALNCVRLNTAAYHADIATFRLVGEDDPDDAYTKKICAGIAALR